MSASKIVMRLVSISFTVLIFLMVVYGLYELGLRSYSYGYRIFAEPPVSEGEGRDRLVQIKNTMSDKDIAALLEEKGLIRDSMLFVLQLKLSGYSGRIVSGHYTLNTSMKAEEMMQIMSQEETEETEQEKSQ
ncbi:MAG: endolytic transglycosylase MltG [Eubacterium sp.]|nr:endolytic transglycosylase MltG [Eubacterium sp.]